MKFYVCSTPYHLFVSLCYIMRDKEESYIYMSTHDANTYNLFNVYNSRLKNLTNIKGTFVRKRSNIFERLFIEDIKDRIQYKKIKMILEKSQLINFSWNPYSLYSPSEYVYKKCKTAVFIEEGSSYLKCKPSPIIQIIKKYLFNRNINFYNDDKILKILVPFPDKYPKHLKHKLDKLNLSSLYSDISENDKKEIIRVFDSKIDFKSLDKNSVIILTQPLYEDGYISEKEKIEMYEKIVEDNKKYYNVILKKHPREVTNYNIKDVQEIDGSFPSEIFTLLDIEFKKAIGICTSAINSIKAKEAYNIDEKFFEKN